MTVGTTQETTIEITDEVGTTTGAGASITTGEIAITTSVNQTLCMAGAGPLDSLFQVALIWIPGIRSLLRIHRLAPLLRTLNPLTHTDMRHSPPTRAIMGESQPPVKFDMC